MFDLKHPYSITEQFYVVFYLILMLLNGSEECASFLVHHRIVVLRWIGVVLLINSVYSVNS